MKAWTLLVAVGCGDGKRESPSTNDEACAEQVVYADADGDGFGDPFAALRSCDPPDTHVDNRTDCDDENPDEFPGQIWFRRPRWHRDASASLNRRNRLRLALPMTRPRRRPQWPRGPQNHLHRRRDSTRLRGTVNHLHRHNLPPP